MKVRVQKGQKYSIALYHFNVQYLAGNTQAETYIVTESMHSILLMYERHPSWKFDVELSGLGLETIHDKYKSTYALLLKLIKTGQLELILSPYSMQLSIAYTYEDMEKSLEIDEKLLRKYGLEKSSILFLQESQWHPTWLKLKKYGYDTFLVAESTLEYHGIPNPAPVLEYSYLGEKGYLVVYPDPGVLHFEVGQGGIRKARGVSYVWRWADDGECANTDAGSGKPAEAFRLNVERMKLHETKLEDLEKRGFRFIKISEWVKAAESKGFIEKLDGAQQFIPEAVWQLNEISIHLWMGINLGDYENDGYVRAVSYRVRNKLLATETLFNWYKDELSPNLQREIEASITQAWKHLLLSEVSDSTGWIPMEEEVLYTLKHAEMASEYCDKIVETLREIFDFAKVQVFTDTGIVTSKISIPHLETVNEEEMPRYARIAAEGSEYSVDYCKVSYLNQTYYLAEVNVQPSEDYKIVLSLSTDKIYYSPSLAEDTIQLLPSYPNPICLPLSNGLIYSGGVAVVKNASQHHVALTVEGGKMYFEEINQHNLVKMSFVIKECSLKEALKLADIINTHPATIFES